jgi:hypothetical protein
MNQKQHGKARRLDVHAEGGSAIRVLKFCGKGIRVELKQGIGLRHGIGRVGEKAKRKSEYLLFTPIEPIMAEGNNKLSTRGGIFSVTLFPDMQKYVKLKSVQTTY